MDPKLSKVAVAVVVADRHAPIAVRPIPNNLWDAAAKLIPTNGSNRDWWKQGVEEASKRRAIRDASLKLAHDIGDPSKPITETVTQLETFVVKNTTATRSASVSSREVLKSQRNQMKAAAERRKKGLLSGIPTGLWKLDKLTEGFQAGEMAIIGARPSKGKPCWAATSHARQL